MAVASYRCFWDLAHTGQRMEAERALEAILRREADNPGALLFLGLRQDERGINPDETLGRAVAAYQAVADPEGEGDARLSLFGFRCLAARKCDENTDQLDRTEALAQQHRLSEVLALSLLTPLRDDESSGLLTSFDRRLAEGSSLSEAMARARRDRIHAGAPPAAWGAMIGLGDGAIRPVPDSVRRDRMRRRMERLIAVGGVMLATVAGVLVA